MADAKIMIVESDSLVAEDIAERLQTLGYTVCAVASSGAEAVARAAEVRPDLALIDTGLEGELEGIEVAKEISNRFNIPVVYLIDSMNEDLLEKVKVTREFGYVFKPYETNQLRLTIENQLYRYAEDQKAMDEEQRRSAILNNIGDAVITTDEGGFVTFMNPVAEILTGWPLEEAGREYITHVFNVSIGESNRSIRTSLMNVLHRGITLQWGLSGGRDAASLNAKSGLKIAIDYHAAPLRDKQRNIVGIAVTFRDMRKHKAIETELEQTITELQNQNQLMETVLNGISDGIIVINPEGSALLTNPSAERIFGMPPQNIKPNEWAETYGIFYSDQETYIPADQMPVTQALQGKVLEEAEFFIRNKEQPDGVYAKGRAVPLFDSSGEIRGSVAIIRDITQDKKAAAQLEQTIDELEHQVQLTDTVFNSISDGVVVTDEEGNFLLVNPSAKQIVGMGATEAIPDEWAEKYGTFYPDQVTPFPSDQLPLVHAIQGKSTDGVDVFIRNPENPDGNFINVHGRPLQDQKNEVRGGVIVFRDVTQIKRAEARLEQTIDELEKQAQLMDTIFDSMSDGVVVADDKGQYIMANPAAERMISRNFEDLNLPRASEQYGLFDPATDALFPADQLPLALAIEGKATNNVEMRVSGGKSSQAAYVSVNGRPLLDKNGILRGGVVVARDVTELKEAEFQLEQTVAELQNQNQLMDTVFNSISDGVSVTDEKGNLLLVNPEAEQIIGIGLTETPPDKWAEKYGIFHLDKTTPFPAGPPLMRVISGEAIDDLNLFIRNSERPGGVYVSVSGRPLRSNDGDVTGSVIAFRDVTELKEAEIQLEQTITELENQNQLMDIVLNSISDGVIATDTNGKYLIFSEKMKQLLGVPLVRDLEIAQRPRAYGLFYSDKKTLIAGEDLPLTRAMHGEITDDIELFVRNSELSEGIFIKASGRPLQDPDGNLIGGVVLVRDVTEFKETEIQLEQTITELQNQTQLMETVFNNMSDGVILANNNEGQYIMANRTAEQMIGRRLQRPVGLREAIELYGFFLPDEKTPFPVDQLPIARALRGEPAENIGMFIYNSSTMREGIHVNVSARPLYDTQGSMTGSVSVSRDVTELRQAETNLKDIVEQLEEQGALLESIFNSISDGVVVADVDGNFRIFNPSAERIIGVGATETETDEWSDTYGLFFPDRVTPFPTDELPLVRAIQGEIVDDLEMFVRNPNVPEGVFISVNARPLHDDEGNAKGGVAVFRDVTQRMVAEEALTQAFAQGRLEIVDTILHNIGNAINSVTSGAEILQRELQGNPLIPRLTALASAIKAREDNWIDYIKNDPQGQQVLPFICAIAADFKNQNDRWLQRAERIKQRATHIADIVITQKSFGNSSIVRKDVNIYEVIDDALKLQQESISRRGVEIDIDCENAPQEIRIQESQFHQMLANLIKNSIEAIDELIQSGGLNETPRIRIRTYVDGDFYCLEVIDNGIGVEQENNKLIFAAGYTTKKSGSGLGLHSIANFVISAGGKIEPVSEGIGKGMTMRVMLRLSSVLP